MIKLQVIGNLGRDAVVNNVNGKTVINFSVAHTEKYKDQNGATIDRTTWVECAYWSDKTAIAPYLLKGHTVYAEGNPVVETYTSKDGKQGVALRMRVQSIQLVGNRPPQNDGNSPVVNATHQSPAVASNNMEANAVEDNSDLPF